MVDEKAVWESLKNCFDPEIPINIVDLGLIYDVKVDDGLVKIKMTLTAPGCPMSSFLADDVRQKVSAVDNVKNVIVDIVWDPLWNPSMMSQEAKLKLGFED
ncbi:putative 1,2-phenylacetyl-CoA epoxidase, subunit D [bacterium BMS3Abin05]|nr:putative 1,2-phenylacetyl-CoA epoxidase, subunit D [bacterium BMS3Abin05]GBE28907.1 putative 1,2-phenylacetyl-CoA epoxidase, subunit D [bacterium BMS3Bbin03]